MENGTIVDGTLEITFDELSDFLVSKGVSKACRCGGEMTVAKELDGKPSLNAVDDPRDRDSENWFFWTVCSSCNRVDFYSAGHVWMQIRDGGRGDEN
ncbi:hypothetical protein [Pseudomonas viridiflava]|uniref:hypothetical protein n=1 Tax=Pseudomonas viridiflava TaxID=33069 RepID=UPI0013D84DEE|nr:hypothetical protein [Pseudomonas viridiflava]